MGLSALTKHQELMREHQLVNFRVRDHLAPTKFAVRGTTPSLTLVSTLVQSHGLSWTVVEPEWLQRSLTLDAWPSSAPDWLTARERKIAVQRLNPTQAVALLWWVTTGKAASTISAPQEFSQAVSALAAVQGMPVDWGLALIGLEE